MATFKAVVRAHHQRKDGKYPVSIRLTHNRTSVYLPTGLYISAKQINRKCFEIKDQFVIERTNRTIESYETSLLSLETEELLSMSAQELSTLICKKYQDVEFISFAESLIEKNEVPKGAMGTILSVIRNQMGYEKVMLKQIDDSFVKRFFRCVDDMQILVSRKAGETRTKPYSARTKNAFITYFHMAFQRALETIDLRYRHLYVDGFTDKKYYKGDAKKIDSVSVPLIRKFLSITYDTPLQEMSKDIIKMLFCLGGMNIGDLLLAKKTDYKDGRITYGRNKIKNRRADGGITSIRVEPEIQDLFDKYSSMSTDEYLFNFQGMRFSRATARNFGMTINRMCKLKELPHINYYMFRHSVGTIARNKCGFTKDDVGLLLNHKGKTTVDDAYIDVDWSLIDKINRAVLDYVFHSDKE